MSNPGNDEMVNKLAFENGRMRFLIGEAIASLVYAESCIASSVHMHHFKEWMA